MRRELVTGYTVRRCEQLETFPETIKQELRPAVCERSQTDRLKENYSISQSASPIQHTVNLVFGYKVFLKVYFNVKIHADFKSVCSQTQNVERFAKSMI